MCPKWIVDMCQVMHSPGESLNGFFKQTRLQTMWGSYFMISSVRSVLECLFTHFLALFGHSTRIRLQMPTAVCSKIDRKKDTNKYGAHMVTLARETDHHTSWVSLALSCQGPLKSFQLCTSVCLAFSLGLHRLFSLFFCPVVSSCNIWHSKRGEK